MSEDQKKVILSVDDEPTNRLIIENHLKKEHKVISVESGAKALNFLENEEVDLILLDIMMPEMNGIEVCKKIRLMQKFKETPIIFLTAMDQASDVKEGLESGANDYISKPFRSVELKARVSTQLKIAISIAD